jgi:DNA-binding transcriptional regulator YiaG
MKRGWNQVICARYLGVCHKTLKNWEAGRMKPAKNFLPVIREFILSLPT